MQIDFSVAEAFYAFDFATKQLYSSDQLQHLPSYSQAHFPKLDQTTWKHLRQEANFLAFTLTEIIFQLHWVTIVITRSPQDH